MTSAIRPDTTAHGGGIGHAADWLTLAAAPTFATMAVLTAKLGGGPLDALCAQNASPLAGMVPMYVLMSAFHSAPWVRLIVKLCNRPLVGFPHIRDVDKVGLQLTEQLRGERVHVPESPTQRGTRHARP